MTDEKTKLTLFSAPKPYTNHHINIIQRNALHSWLDLGEDVEIILVGEEKGLLEVAEEFQVIHQPAVQRNDWGTPRVNSIFSQARKISKSDLLVYVNADIILPPNFVKVVCEIEKLKNHFLIVGKRWDLSIKDSIQFEKNWFNDLEKQAKTEGRLHGPAAMDYFIFPRKVFKEIPPFAIGRAGWDNWMIYHAMEKGYSVIDATPAITVIHQQHNYSHLPGGETHHNLEESYHNVRLGGGFNKVYDLLDVELVYAQGEITKAKWTLLRVLRKLERWVMPETKRGWRWQLTRKLRQLRKYITKRQGT